MSQNLTQQNVVQRALKPLRMAIILLVIGFVLILLATTISERNFAGGIIGVALGMAPALAILPVCIVFLILSTSKTISGFSILPSPVIKKKLAIILMVNLIISIGIIFLLIKSGGVDFYYKFFLSLPKIRIL